MDGEKTAGKERAALADYYPPNEKGGRGRMSPLPLSPALYATTNLDNLMLALRHRTRGIAWKNSVLGFRAHAVQNLLSVSDSLRSGKYKLLPYSKKEVFEPKRRQIVITSLRDGVVQRCLCERYLTKKVCSSFIWDDAASPIGGKGPLFAQKRLKCLLHRHWLRNGREGWAVRFDVHDFFGSLDHDWLKKEVERRITDPFAVAYCEMVIDSYERGLGLGSEISQLLALMCLDGIDHAIKERFRAKCYVRYMDDGVIVVKTKEEAKALLSFVGKELEARNLTLNPKKSFIAPLSKPIPFLGWRFVLKENGRILALPKKGKGNEIVRKGRRMLKAGIPKADIKESFQSSMAHLEWGDSGREISKIRRFMEEEL